MKSFLSAAMFRNTYFRLFSSSPRRLLLHHLQTVPVFKNYMPEEPPPSIFLAHCPQDVHASVLLRLSTSHVRTNRPDKSPANRNERMEAAKKRSGGGETDSVVWFCGNLWVVTMQCKKKKKIKNQKLQSEDALETANTICGSYSHKIIHENINLYSPCVLPSRTLTSKRCI